MFDSVLGFALSAVAALNGGASPFNLNDILALVQNSDRPEAAAPVCGAVDWVKPPVMNGDIFEGAIQTQCSIQSTFGGDFDRLQNYALKQLLEQGGKIDRGPIAETFEDLPSNLYDITIDRQGKDRFIIREEAHIATDRQTKLISAANSKSIGGTGNAKYLKKIDARIEVLNTDKVGTHTLIMSGVTHIERPWYAPEGMFMSEIKERLPKEIVKIRDKVAQEVSVNF